MPVMISAMVRVFLVALCVFLPVVGVYGAEDTHVVIMHTNDIHGHLLPGPDGAGSARLSTVVRELKPDLMLDAGNMFSGALISDAFQGEPVVEVMNAIGYDAMVVGNHEFNFGLKNLSQARSQARFPWISANIRVERRATQRPFAAYFVKMIAGEEPRGAQAPPPDPTDGAKGG